VRAVVEAIKQCSKVVQSYNVCFRSVHNLQSYHKSLAQLCHRELVEQMLLFKTFVSHGSATRFLRDSEIYFADNSLLFPTV